MRRGRAVRRAEVYGPFATPVCDEEILEDVGVALFHMQKRRAGAYRRRCHLFSFGKPPEQRVRIVNHPGPLRKVRHVAQNPGFRLGAEREIDGVFAE